MLDLNQHIHKATGGILLIWFSVTHWTRWCSIAQLSYLLMQVTEPVFYKTKPGETCKQNKTGMDGDLSPGLLFPYEISKVYLNKGSDQKAPCPANTRREHCYLVGIASPALGDVRVGLAQKVSPRFLLQTGTSLLSRELVPYSRKCSTGFLCRHPTIYIGN